MTAIDRRRIEAAVTELLAAIGEDPARAGLQSTPQRVADSYQEFFGGLAKDPTEPLADAVSLEGHEAEVVLMRDIAFRSMCEHHLLPFLGAAHIAYLPGDHVVGLGRLPVVVDILATRPQTQERLTDEIADALVTGLGPRGVLVVLEASHNCVSTRSVRQVDSTTVTIASRGELTEPAARAELMTLIAAGAQ